jgi:hypothetical protein
MMSEHQPLRVLVVSSGNPAAASLAASLLRCRPSAIGAVMLHGVETSTPAPEVLQVLEEVGCAWAPHTMRASPAKPVDVGLTICVPT